MKKLLIPLLLGALVLHASHEVFRTERIALKKKQSRVVVRALDRESNQVTRNEMISLLNYIDSVYSAVFDRVRAGKKLTIFFDPAHGLLPDGQWEGAACYKLGCDARPEELYSIPLSRAFYKKLRSNKHIVVATTADYLELLQGRTETYNNIYFKETVRLAKKARAFMIISSHLNNVGPEEKRDGNCNLPGLHQSYTMEGGKIATYVYGQHEGYLNVYNELDSSGISALYSRNIIQRLVKTGVKINHWNNGSVGYNKLTSFVEFPVGIIFETGFISHPGEGRRLKDPEYIDAIATVQYQALVDTIKTVLGWDLLGGLPDETVVQATYRDRIELLKLGRIATMYIKDRKLASASMIIKKMRQLYGHRYKAAIRPFIEIASKLNQAEQWYAASMRYYKQHDYQQASKALQQAMDLLWESALLKQYKYSYEATQKFLLRHVAEPLPIEEKVYSEITMDTPVIMGFDRGWSLEKALRMALAPGDEKFKALYRGLQEAHLYQKAKRYDRDKKQWQWYWKKTARQARYYPGVYIFRITNDLQITEMRRVKTAPLEPSRYQNQMFMRNSWFSNK